MNVPQPAAWPDVLARLKNESRFAFDLEGDFNLHRYGRRICLYQIALDDGSIFLLDPVDNGPPESWVGWKEILENPLVTKVIWAAQNDIRVLKACHEIHLRGLWDLFDAACLAVTPRPSLPFLTAEFLATPITKSEVLQTGDWNIRPLTAAQRQYAAQDVAFLLELHDKIDPLITEKSKRTAFEARMRKAEAYEFSEVSEPWRKAKGSALLSPEQQETLARLWKRRDLLARGFDLAPWRLIPHEGLVALSRDGILPSDLLVDPRWSPE